MGEYFSSECLSPFLHASRYTIDPWLLSLQGIARKDILHYFLQNVNLLQWRGIIENMSLSKYESRGEKEINGKLTFIFHKFKNKFKRTCKKYHIL